MAKSIHQLNISEYEGLIDCESSLDNSINMFRDFPELNPARKELETAQHKIQKKIKKLWPNKEWPNF